MKNKHRYIHLLFLSFFAFGCSLFSEEQQVAENQVEKQVEKVETKLHLTEEQFKTSGIELGEVVQKKISNILKVNGMIDVPPQNLVSIAIPMGGFVKSTEMLQGLKVGKGEVMAVIENRDFIQLQQDFLDTQSKLEYAQAEYERQKEMQKAQVTSDKAVQQTTADYKSLQVRLKALEQHLKLLNINVENLKKGNITNSINILAPISGYVTTVNVNIGKHVSPAEVLFEIVNTEHLHAELNVFEKDVPLLKIGQKVQILVGNESHAHEGSIFLINHKIADDRTVNVHVHFDDKGEDLLPKTFLKALISIDEQAVTALPNEAFIFSDGKDYIFAYLGKNKENLHEFEMIEAQKGASENGFTQLTANEKIDLKGKKIATKGGFSLMAKLMNVGEEE
jgi:RND family efflux transporter MFP subunit